jgi:hypothetical protein
MRRPELFPIAARLQAAAVDEVNADYANRPIMSDFNACQPSQKNLDLKSIIDHSESVI